MFKIGDKVKVVRKIVEEDTKFMDKEYRLSHYEKKFGSKEWYFEGIFSTGFLESQLEIVKTNPHFTVGQILKSKTGNVWEVISGNELKLIERGPNNRQQEVGTIIREDLGSNKNKNYFKVIFEAMTYKPRTATEASILAENMFPSPRVINLIPVDKLFKLPIKNNNKPKSMIKKLSNFITKAVNEDTQALIKAGYVNSDLEPTEKGYEALREILYFENQPKLVERAKAEIATEEAKKA